MRSCASRLESGSSNSTILESNASARASATRCCWPPDSRVAGRSAKSARSTSASARSTAGPRVASRAMPRTRKRERDVVEHRHVRPDRIGLEHHRQAARVPAAGDDCRQRRRTTRAVDRDAPAGRPLQTGDGTQRRRLAAAGRAEQRDVLASSMRKRHAIHRADRDRSAPPAISTETERQRHAATSRGRRRGTAAAMRRR